MPKNKSHKGLLKRVRVTSNGKVKMQRAFGRHLRSHKRSTLLRKYRQPKYATQAETKRLSAMLARPIRSNRYVRAEILGEELSEQ